MKKALTFFTAITLIAVLAGCGGNTPAEVDFADDVKDRAKEETTIEINDDKEEVETDNGESNAPSGLIFFSYKKHPMSLKDGDDMLATGQYYSIELDEGSKEAYADLDKALNEFNEAQKQDLTQFLTDSQGDVMELRGEGMDFANYEMDEYIYPSRADGKVFSLILQTYGYYSGAHGSSTYHGYNIDTSTGRDIEFDEVIKDKSNLSGIIFDDLIAQNEDLVEYFETCPTDKDNLISEMEDAFSKDTENFAWAIRYDGLDIVFNDYAMGSYAAGARGLKLLFKDHPEIFTDTFNDSVDGEYPDIEGQGKELPDAEEEIIEADVSSDGSKVTRAGSESLDSGKKDQKPSAVKQIELTPDLQYKLNVFISNFAEQGMGEFDQAYPDVKQIVDFAYMWKRINKPEEVKIDGQFYKISIDDIKELCDKYFDYKISSEELNGYTWDDADFECIKDGYYYRAAADGEAYTGFAIVDTAEDAGDGTFWVYFTTFSLDLEDYWNNDEVIPKKYYKLSLTDARKTPEIVEGYGGMAIVKKDGDSYKLQYYKTY
ncbi:MAG: hypothetical protein K6G22_09645 [Lachnospiraceae bacterium]|nr:hypothetical protein [Lachnospiraceae bacterium]